MLGAGNSPAAAVSLLLAGSLCLLPFLVPFHQPPILSFQAEWLAAALGIAAALAASAVRGARVASIPFPARWLVAFALFLGAQPAIGHAIYPQLPLIGALYVLYAALMIWLGAQLADSCGMERAAVALATCLLAGALANAAAGAIQFYGRPALLEDIVAELPYRAGAFGNIAQANLYANYLALGATALLFLWERGKLRTGYAHAAAILLACACALSGSRSSLLYAFWFALLGLLAGRARQDGRRLKIAACSLAMVFLAAHVAVPWLNATFELGTSAKSAIERSLSVLPENVELRWELWLLAWRVFADAPVLGAGFGEFAGAAFGSGLAPAMTQFGNEVWSSPHNLVLHLLAETGALGGGLALAGLCTWWWQAGRRYLAAPQPALWWVIAAVGIEAIHSMFEFPLWSVHFLGVTALLMGLGTRPGTSSGAASRVTRTAAIAVCITLSLALAMLLRDYVRLDSTRITGTSVTLASTEDAERDAGVMRALARGPLAPVTELWIILGTPPDRNDLAARLEMSGRVARYFPANAVIVRRAVFLAFDGNATKARALLAQAVHLFPRQCKSTMAILEQALASDRSAIEPLLTQAKAQMGKSCP